MELIDRLTGKDVEKRVAAEIARQLPAIREDLERASFAEATSPEASTYAFEHLTGRGQGTNDLGLPKEYTERAIRSSHMLYETHGIAGILIGRTVSDIFENGIDVDVQFAEGFDKGFEKETRDVLQRFTDSEDVDFQERCYEFTLETLLDGEHGMRLEVEPVNGQVSVYDIARRDVAEITADGRDPRRLKSVKIHDARPGDANPSPDAGKCLEAVRLEDGFLRGDCLYFRIDARASKLRGTPLLQRVVDELTADKKFRIRTTDRISARMSTFVDATLTDAGPKQIAEAQQQYPRIPSGGVWFHNQNMQLEYKSANIEAADVTQMIRTGITLIGAAFGRSISEFGFGDGSTKATAEVQRSTSFLESRRMKRGIFGTFERLLYFVVDQAIIAGRITGGTIAPDAKVQVLDETGAPVMKKLRECITITVRPRPLEEATKTGTPLATTKAAAEILTMLKEIEANGTKVLTPENIAALLTFAGQNDGTGIKVVPEDVEAVAAGEFPVGGPTG